MSRFYLNNYKWFEIVFAILTSLAFFLYFPSFEIKTGIEIAEKIINASDSLFGAIASLLGFVFATITILIGLGDNYKSNDTSKELINIIEKLKNDKKLTLTVEESAKIKNKYNASSLFFSTSAYELTLKSLFGCVRVLSLVFVFSLLVSIVGEPSKNWSTIVLFYLTLALFSIIRILFLMGYLIKILTNKETSDK
jgi:hypothetical protein